MRIILIIMLGLGNLVHAGTLQKVGSLNIVRPAFLSIHQDQLIVSQFGLFHKGQVSVLKGLKESLQNLDKIQFKTLIEDRNVSWPNEVHLFDSRDSGWAGVVSSGFLVPGKSNGGVFLLNGDILSRFRAWFSVDLDVNLPFFKTALTRISPDEKGWWYHRTRKFKDGFLTARAKIAWGKKYGELLYLYRNEGNRYQWLSQKIADGPDVHFELYDFDQDGFEEIICTEFFNKRLSMLQYVDGSWQYTIIDDQLGSAFDIQITDLDQNDRVELLVTNHEADLKAGVFVYEINVDSGIHFTRHKILDGIETRQGGMGSASPGKAEAFVPDALNPSRPWILVNGDGSQRAHLLKPESQESGEWNYSEEIILDAGCTVGQSAIADIDGDGGVEIFVPAYDKDTIHIFSYKK